MGNNTYDWIGLMQRTKKAHTPTFGQKVVQPFAESFSQGMIGKSIAQDELKKALIIAMLKTSQPMVKGAIPTAGVEGVTTEKSRPATIEEIMANIQGKPGLIPGLFGAKPPEELTWKPIKTEWKPETKEEAIEVKEAGKTPTVKTQKIDNILYQHDPTTGNWVPVIEGEKEGWIIKPGKKYYWRINPTTGKAEKTEAPVETKEKVPTEVSNALNLLKSYVGYKEKDLIKLGVLGQVKAARGVVNSQPEFAKRLAGDVDDYFDKMMDKYNGDVKKAMAKTQGYMEILGISQRTIEPYMRQR